MPHPLILLTGATGAVGRHLALELKSRRVPLRILARDPEKASRLLGPAEFAVGSLSQPETVERALRGVEAAFLLSPLDPSLSSWETDFARAAKKAGVKRLVKLSVFGANQASPASLARWHGEAEEKVRLAGVPFTILRPAAFYQNFLSSAGSMRRGAMPAPMGSARMAMVDARDTAAAAAAALMSSTHAGATLTLTGPEPLSYAEAAAIFSRVLGRPIAYADVPPETAERVMLAAGMPAWKIDALLGLAGIFRADAASDGVRAATGRDPLSFESFVRDHAAAFA